MKLIEVEERIADLTVIRTALQQTIEVGCTDLMACAQERCCPLPFAELAAPDRLPDRSTAADEHQLHHRVHSRA